MNQSQKIRGYTGRIITRQISVIIGIWLVLFFLGVLGLLLINTKNLANQVKEEISFSVYLSDQITPFEINEIRNFLEIDPVIKTLNYISKEQAAEEFAEVIGEDFIEFLGHNPLQSSFEIQFHASFVTIDSLEMKKSELLGLFPLVQEIVYNSSVLNVLGNNFSKIIFVLIVIVGFFLFLTMVMINTTVKLSIYSKRVVIKTMQLVGAPKSFIRKPFVHRNLWLGVIASILTIVSLALMVHFLQTLFPQLNLMNNIIEVGVLLISIPMISLFITGISSYMTTSYYLRIRTVDAYKF
ncbi:MAG: permease-like cell division protein FtsX [Flavobacteriaceae bacterium]|nr:permease-like cell division protein FtsX [Flavobacteriaceae bacterium]MCY4267135.1 permease-like cell division protein FtsX [Flavobacteriaceae bacterium]MCY4299917.1 permease-like cell division protein FtsX [Flavobacteriaceae bacterium]